MNGGHAPSGTIGLGVECTGPDSLRAAAKEEANRLARRARLPLAAIFAVAAATGALTTWGLGGHRAGAPAWIAPAWLMAFLAIALVSWWFLGPALGDFRAVARRILATRDPCWLRGAVAFLGDGTLRREAMQALAELIPAVHSDELADLSPREIAVLRRELRRTAQAAECGSPAEAFAVAILGVPSFVADARSARRNVSIVLRQIRERPTPRMGLAFQRFPASAVAG